MKKGDYVIGDYVIWKYSGLEFAGVVVSEEFQTVLPNTNGHSIGDIICPHCYKEVEVDTEW